MSSQVLSDVTLEAQIKVFYEMSKLIKIEHGSKAQTSFETALKVIIEDIETKLDKESG